MKVRTLSYQDDQCRGTLTNDSLRVVPFPNATPTGNFNGAPASFVGSSDLNPATHHDAFPDDDELFSRRDELSDRKGTSTASTTSKPNHSGPALAIETQSQPPVKSQSPEITYIEVGERRIKVRMLSDQYNESGTSLANNNLREASFSDPSPRDNFDNLREASFSEPSPRDNFDETPASFLRTSDLLPAARCDAFSDDDDFFRKRDEQSGRKKTSEESHLTRSQKMQEVLQKTSVASTASLSERFFQAQLIMRPHPSATIPGHPKTKLWESKLGDFEGDSSWLIPESIHELSLEALIPEDMNSSVDTSGVSRHQKNLSLALHSNDFHKLISILNRPIKLRNLYSAAGMQTVATPIEPFVYALLKMQFDDEESKKLSSIEQRSVVCLKVIFTKSTQAAYEKRTPVQWGGRGQVGFFESPRLETSSERGTMLSPN